MHRIDADDNVANLFVDAVPMVSPATVCDASWLNDVQEELCNVVTAAGITLVSGTQTQLLAAIRLLARAAKGRFTAGGTPALVGSAVNVASLAINNTNYVRVTFTTAMPDTNYHVLCRYVDTSGQSVNTRIATACNHHTTYFDIAAYDAAGAGATVNMSTAGALTFEFEVIP